MGLDMYLTKRTYIGNQWVRDGGELRLEVSKGPDNVKQERISYVIEDVGYWRKANSIHAWFVDNVQGGNDDGKDYYISIEQLQELLITVNTVLDSIVLEDSIIQNGTRYEPGADGKAVAIPIFEPGKTIVDASVAKELLPTRSGFFFGSTDYDEWYYDDLVHTKEILESVLAEDNGSASYYYYASW